MTLNEFLAEQQLNQARFAALVGVPGSTVHRWVRGKRKPSIAYLPKIERATGWKVLAQDFYPRCEAAE